MNDKLLDIMIATTGCTMVSLALMYTAHLIEAGHILNPNWNFAVYFCIAISVFFMILPYLLTRNITSDYFISDDEKAIIEGLMKEYKIMNKAVDHCYNREVLEYPKPRSFQEAMGYPEILDP